MVGIFSLVTGRPGASGFGSSSTAEQVTEGIDASNLTAIITGQNITSIPSFSQCFTGHTNVHSIYFIILF